MPARTLDKYLRRYTSLSSVLDTLANRHLVLLSPAKWDDANDVQFMQLYAEHKGAGSVLALCCTMSSETYHHWRVFSHGMDGICIEFDRLALEASLKGRAEITAGPIEYLYIKQLAALSKKSAGRLPFFKRDGFSDEREYRIVATLDEPARLTHEVPIELSAIRRLIFSPSLPPALARTLRQQIKAIPGCEKMSVQSSKLTNSAEWKSAGQRLIE